MVLVLELGHIVAGPSAGLILSDLGYDVVKIEKPGEGDVSRRLTNQSSGSFPYYNRNKRSIAINLKDERGKDILGKLSMKADIIIDNLSYGTLDRLGFSYSELSKNNPGLIYLSLKGYGKGQYEKRKSLDYPIEVHSGLAYMTGLTGRPMRVGASLVDMGAAMFGVIGILNALMEREKTGMGKYIDVGLFETAMFFMGQHISTYQILNKPLKPINEEGFAWGIYDFFETKDGGKIFIAVTTDMQWKEFSKALVPELKDDPSLDRNEGRYSKRNTLIPILEEKIMTIDSQELFKTLDRINVSYATLHRPWELLEDPHARPKMFTERYKGKDITVPATPLGGRYIRDPPELGENDEEILKFLGFSENEIDVLKRDKII